MTKIKNKFRISLLLLFITAVGMSVYSLWNVSAGTKSTADTSKQIFQQKGNIQSPLEGFPAKDSTQQKGFPSGNKNSNSNSAKPNGMPHSQQETTGANQPGNGSMFHGMSSQSSSNKTYLCIYAVLFLGLFVAGIYLLSKKKFHIQTENQMMLLWTLLGVGFFLKMAVAPWVDGYSSDINLFKNWATSAANHFSGFYLHGSSDYPPFYIYVLYIVGKMAAWWNAYFDLLIKVPSIVADSVTAYLVYRIAARKFSFEKSALLAMFYLFNPAILINSTFWGQVDSFFTMLVVLAVYCLAERKVYPSTIFFTLAVLMKPQGIIYLPVLFFVLVQLKNIKQIIGSIAVAVGTALVVILPFSFGQSWNWIFKLYTRTISEYPYASVNAYNFFSLIGANYKQDTTVLFLFSYHTWGMIFIVCITLLAGFVILKGKNLSYIALSALLLIVGVFTFSTGMHERYLFPATALSLLACIYFKDRYLLWLSVGFSTSIFLNTYAIMYGAGQGNNSSSFTMIATSMLNVVLFAFLVKFIVDKVRNPRDIILK